MRNLKIMFVGVGLTLSVVSHGQTMAGSLGLFVYPSDGQVMEQQATDEAQCYQWAGQQTGVDPMNPMAGVQVEQPQTGGEGNAAARGAVRGAARAGIIGNLADEDASDWAAAGAVVGEVAGTVGVTARFAGVLRRSRASCCAARNTLPPSDSKKASCFKLRSATS